MEVKLLALVYGSKRLIGTQFSNMTYQRFIKRYWTTIVRVLHKIALQQSLSEDELPIIEALISFTQSFRDLGVMIGPKINPLLTESG